MKKIIALVCMLIALAFSGSPALFADSGVLASADHHAAQGVIGNCQTCHAVPDQRTETIQRRPPSKIGAGSSNIQPRNAWGIKPTPYYSRVSWHPD